MSAVHLPLPVVHPLSSSVLATSTVHAALRAALLVLPRKGILLNALDARVLGRGVDALGLLVEII